MAIVTVKSADDVRIEQIGGAVTMKGWLRCEMRNRCEQQQVEIERLTRERGALLACRRGDQRCHECPDVECADNLNNTEAAGGE